MARPVDQQESGGTLVAQVIAEIKRRIAARTLAPGMRIPSIRRMAETLGVSKSTVVEAYDRLVAEGVIAPRPGSGFYVAARPQPLSLAAIAPRLDREIDPLWMSRQSLETGEDALKPGCGWLPASWMPEESLRRALRALSRDSSANLMDYASPLGFAPLRERLSMRMAERNIAAGPNQIVLTDSASQAIDLLCRFLLSPGDTVLVDDPCYFNVHAVLRAHRVNIIGVPRLPQGPDLDVFADMAVRHQPRLYITNASLHNPTGASLTLAVAHRLLTIAEAHDMLVIEDDIFADFEVEPSPKLAALDGLERVIYIGSFAKTLSAAARCGFIATKAAWVEEITDLKLATSFSNASISAQLVHHLLTDGSYRRHVEMLRTRLSGAMGETRRRLEALGLQLWTVPQGGMFLWAMLPEGMDSAAVARHALRRDVVMAPGNVFSVSQSSGRYLRFNAAQCASPRIFEVLAEAMADPASRAGPRQGMAA